MVALPQGVVLEMVKLQGVVRLLVVASFQGVEAASFQGVVGVQLVGVEWQYQLDKQQLKNEEETMRCYQDKMFLRHWYRDCTTLHVL